MDYDPTTGMEEDPTLIGAPAPRVLKRTLNKKQNAGGAVTDTVQPEPVLPSAISQYRSRAADAYKQGLELMNTEPDMSGLQDYARQRSQQGDAEMLNALAAQYAGKRFEPIQAQYLKRAAAARDPIKAGNGFITPDGQYIQDPSAGQDKRAEFLLNMARQYETLAQTAETAQERLAAQRAQNEITNQLRLMSIGVSQMNAQTSRMNAGGAPGVGKAPSGYQWTPDGQLTYIPGGPADPKTKTGGAPTEDERKASGWYFQADSARRNMENVIKTDPNAAFPTVTERAAGFIPGVGGDVANTLRSENRQKFVQASESMAEALLRAATGAGVNKDEAAQKVRELVPQIGDKPGVVQQKINSYDMYLKSLQTRAGRALPAGTPGAPGVDDSDPLGIRRK